jgi:hypothetical protein
MPINRLKTKQLRKPIIVVPQQSHGDRRYERETISFTTQLQYTDQEMIPARNARNVVTLAEVMFVTIQRENLLPSKITDYWLTNAHELLTTEWLKY